MTNNSGDKIINQDISVKIYQYAAIVGIPIFTLGLLINIFIFFLFLYDKYFRKTSYMLMCVSVISDMISGLSSLVVYTQIVGRSLDYDGGTFMCRMTLFFMFGSFGVSMMNLGLIGIDRYFIIVKPLSLFYRHHKRYILIIGEVAIWLISGATNIPILSYVAVHQNDTLLCDIPNVTISISVYLCAQAAILLIIPTIVLLAVYGRIIAYQSKYRRPGEIDKRQRIEEQIKKKRFIRMLIWISISYVVISWPFFASSIGMAITGQSIMMIRQKSIVHFLLLFFSIAMTTSIAVLNPFIYLKFDSNVRKRACLLLQRFQRYVYCYQGKTRLRPMNLTGHT